MMALEPWVMLANQLDFVNAFQNPEAACGPAKLAGPLQPDPSQAIYVIGLSMSRPETPVRGHPMFQILDDLDGLPPRWAVLESRVVSIRSGYSA